MVTKNTTDMLPYYWKKKKKKEPKTIYGVEAPKRRKPDLVKKLDRIFAQYIRLRDVMPNGYGQCISCGRIKHYRDLDCGHFYGRTHMSIRFDEDDCNAECKYCLTPDALILTADLRWVRLGDLIEGDEIFSFEEERTTARARRWRKGVVTHLHREVQDVYDVELENGDHMYTTAEHKWLAKKRCGTHYEWVMTKDLWFGGYNLQGKKKSGPHTDKTHSVVCKPFLVVQQDQSYDSGWLAGMIDADGHITQQNIHNPNGTIRHGLRVGVAQCDKYPKIQAKVIEVMERLTGNNKPCRQSMDKTGNHLLRSNYPSYQFLVTGTNVEKLHFLMRTRPHKMSKLDIDKIGMIRSRYDTRVKDVSYIGKREIVVMETDTHTFIANGYAMHNCNRRSSDHLIAYQTNLIRKIGMARFEMLGVKAHQSKKWSDFELEALIKHYTTEVARLKKERNV